MRNLTALLMLFLLCSAMLFAGKPTPQPTYVWKVILVDGGDVSGGDDLTKADNLATAVGCTVQSDPLCTELSGKVGWVFGPADATVRNVVTDYGALFYPGSPKEATFSMLLSASASHKHVKFGPLEGYTASRDRRTTVSKNLTTTYLPATSCFVDFPSSSIGKDFSPCVITNFLNVGQHPAPGYAELRFSFIGPRSLMDEMNETLWVEYSPATFLMEILYAPGDNAAPCSAQKANIVGWDYPNSPPATYLESALPAAGTFIRRMTTDSWRVEIRADFEGINPFPANPRPDDVTASCYVSPNKFTRDIYENSGRMQLNSTMYFVRTLVK